MTPRVSPLLGLPIVFLMGCAVGPQPAARYVQPLEAEPHADVLVTFAYDARPAPMMSARLFVDGREMELPMPIQSGVEGIVMGVPIKALLTSVRVEFWNQENRTELQTTMHTYMYACGARPHGAVIMCTGTSTSAYPRRRVIKAPVADCSAAAEWTPTAGSRWHLGLKFSGQNACTLTATPGDTSSYPAEQDGGAETRL